MPSKVCRICRVVVPANLFNAHRQAHRDQARERQNSSQRLTRELRELILARDMHRCVICGSRENLEVHHKDEDWKNNSVMNLETRCFDHNPRGRQKARSF